MKIYLLLCAVLLAMHVKSERPRFREDYRYEKAFGAFYKLHKTAVNWHQARIRCEGEGAELIIPDTLDEADAIPVLVSSILTKYDGVFIGVHDLYSERSFVTIQGHSIQDSLLDLLWEPRQPAHSGGRCAAVRRNGRMFVTPCSHRLPFVCKALAEQVIFNRNCNSFDPHWTLGPNNTCYITHEERQTWHDAHSTCLSAGGYLAVLNSREETEYIRDMFKQVDQHKTPGDFAFLGFSDLLQRYHYRTIYGERVDEGKVGWDLRCPQKGGNSEQRCGGFLRTGLLATGDCNRPSVFFCEKPAKGTFILRSALRYGIDNKEYRHKQKIN